VKRLADRASYGLDEESVTKASWSSPTWYWIIVGTPLELVGVYAEECGRYAAFIVFGEAERVIRRREQ
jgi:hypothetical protein